ncbi:MAG: class I SAM-dependent methyltransferase, partial [Bacteroidetes bacterium]|nr:class I SAM-dependent methyltransferase [Bacteroidota bacterium]
MSKKHIYLSTDAYKHNPNYDKHYERYDFMYEHLKPLFDANPALEYLDLGCGDASFIYFLKKRHSDASYTGLDNSDELLEIIGNEPFLNDVTIIKGDVVDYDLAKQFDIALMSGVLSIFDDTSIPLSKMADHIISGGKGYIFGGFNSHDIDVQVRFRNNYRKSDIWESGLNMYSLGTTEKDLEPFASEVKFH